MIEIPELTDEQFAKAIPARVRRRLIRGEFESGEDIAALRQTLLVTVRAHSVLFLGLVDHGVGVYTCPHENHDVQIFGSTSEISLPPVIYQR